MNSAIRKEQQKIDWVTMNMRLNGNPISTENAARIAAGEYILDASLEDHVTVTNLASVLPLMYALFGMQEELSPQTLHKFYQAVSGGESPVYRLSTPVLFHLSYNPVLPQEIEEELRRSFAIAHRDQSMSPLEKAVFIHHQIIRIYPFNDYNEIIARAALEYQLMASGLDLCPITLSEQEYNHALIQFLKKEDGSLLLENLKLNHLMQQSTQ